MTVFGWDASHYDWDRGSMDLAAAKAGGITFATHKIGEGWGYTDTRFDDFYAKAQRAGIPLLGAYYVLRPGDEVAQADRFLVLLDAKAPGWRDEPFILQADCESWGTSPEPSPAEVKAFCARLAARAPGFRPVVYAPKWVYGDRLAGLGYPLWASSYGTNPAGDYRALYPGDTSGRWAAYSGQVPTILQYGSQARIAGQGSCDANAYRGTIDELKALVAPGRDDMNKTEMIAFLKSGEGRDALEPAIVQGLHEVFTQAAAPTTPTARQLAAALRTVIVDPVKAAIGASTLTLTAAIGAADDAPVDVEALAIALEAKLGKPDAEALLNLMSTRLAS
jgi:GH25 family lysozyme M1 (1,4-beta-N-acetylmuramidase)